MRGDVFVAKTFTKVPRNSLGEPSRVDENERGFVLANKLRQPVVNLLPNLA